MNYIELIKEDAKDLKVDCQRIMEAGRDIGIMMCTLDAFLFWEHYSNSQSADWLMLPETDKDIQEILLSTPPKESLEYWPIDND